MTNNYAELERAALEMLEENDELFCDMVDEIDGWNGFADGFRCYPMYEIDEFFCGVSIGDFLDKLTDTFNHRDNYFIDTIYGLDSTDYREDVYRDNTTAEDVLRHVLDYLPHIYIRDPEFKEIVEALADGEDSEEENEEGPEE